MKFVNFKLYHQIGLSYPPNWNYERARKGAFLDSLITNEFIDENKKQEEEKEKQKAKKLNANPDQIESSKERITSLKEAIESIEPGSDFPEAPANEEKKDNNVEAKVFESDETILQRKQEKVYQGLFSRCHFWLSSEVPRESLEFVIKCFGGKVSWEGNGNIDSKKITHHVTDRPNFDAKYITRDYVQPQWIYDSINNQILLPVHDYAPNTVLPPHLSPFVDDYADGYVPDYRKKLDQYYFEKTGIKREREVAQLFEPETPVEDSQLEEKTYLHDLTQERKGNVNLDQKTPEPPKPSLKKKMSEEGKQAKVALAMLSGKHRYILKRQISVYNRRQQRILKLTKKKLALEDGRAKIEDNVITPVEPVRRKKPQKPKEKLYNFPPNHPAWINTRRRRGPLPIINKKRKPRYY